MGKCAVLLLLNCSNPCSYEGATLRSRQQHVSGLERRCGEHASVQETGFICSHLRNHTRTWMEAINRIYLLRHSLFCGL